MKTKLNIALIATALTFGIVGPLSASTPGKDVSGAAGPHKHTNSMQSSTYSHASRGLVKHTRPVGK